MKMITINASIKRPDPELVRQLGEITPSDYGHKLNFQFITASKMKPLFPIETPFAGPAVTVRIPPNDVLSTCKAMDYVQPGDIVVIDASEEDRYACWGEVTTRIAMEKGAAAAIINGAVTDTIAIRDLGFKVYSHSVSPLTTKFYGLGGDINVPVSISGCVIQPGDVIVGSNDGLLVVPKDEIATYLEIGKEAKELDEQNLQDLKVLGADVFLRRLDPLWDSMLEKDE
jgi:4-hydroxy-4-methyl-2-oxoglutarate aldolase